MKIIPLCGCELQSNAMFASGRVFSISIGISAHFGAHKSCDRKARIEFKRLMKKWKQQPLSKDYWENKENSP